MNYKDIMLDIYSDGGDWEDFEPEIDKMELRIAELEAQLAEAEKAIRGIMAVAYPYGITPTKAEAIAYQRCVEFLKKLEDTTA